MKTRISSIQYCAILVVLLCAIARESYSAARKPKVEPASRQNCTNHLQVIDKCSSLATYSYTTSFNPYPTNSVDLKSSCDRISEGLKCLKVHVKCINNMSRRAVTAFSSARNKHSKRICANLNDPKTIDFIKSAQCIKESGKSNVMIANERELIATIQLLAANKTMKWDDRFHQACCSARGYQSKVVKDMQPECEKHKETMEDMMESMIGELLDAACPEPKRLAEICPKLAKVIIKGDWKAVSLSAAALDLIEALSEEEPKKAN